MGAVHASRCIRSAKTSLPDTRYWVLPRQGGSLVVRLLFESGLALLFSVAQVNLCIMTKAASKPVTPVEGTSTRPSETTSYLCHTQAHKRCVTLCGG